MFGRRSDLVLALAVAGFLACGTDPEGFDDGAQNGGNRGDGGGPSIGAGTGGGDSGRQPGGKNIDVASMRVDPPDAVLALAAGVAVTQPYKLLGKYAGEAAEVDLTSRAVFYVPDNYLVGGFPLDGGPTFTSRVPAAPTDPPQRGGKLSVRASIANTDGVHDATTSLTLHMSGTFNAPGDAGNVPADAATRFGGTVSDARQPVLAYPNDGTMLPPNLRRLEVHWKAAGDGANLYEISFRSAAADVTYYARCGSVWGGSGSSCAFELDETGYNALAYSNAGQGPVTLQIKATKDDEAATYGQSAPFTIEFAENRVDGGLYYWNTTDKAIVRFDFGAASGAPEEFLRQNTKGLNGTDETGCPGCHALSRDGTKLVASVGGMNRGRLVFIDDVARASTGDQSWMTVGPASPESQANRIQFASFNPDGTQFVAVYGDGTPDEGAAPIDNSANKLFFHDGTSGLRTSALDLGHRPNHPSWAPSGDMIAFTHVQGASSYESQRSTKGSIELVRREGAGWSAPIEVGPLASVPGQLANRFNPDFAPDSSFLYFTHAVCADDKWDSNDRGACSADTPRIAKTYAAKPEAGAALVELTHAQQLGVGDTLSDTGDTFPRSAPFETAHRAGKLFWFTVASRRNMGLRTIGGEQQRLWMFAVDPAKVLAGQDGSYTGFWLPFQSLTTSNHIGQWTKRVVGGSQPQPEPVPPPPPPPDPGGVN